jgi:hypothetical protein
MAGEKCRHCGGWAADLFNHEQNCVMRPDYQSPAKVDVSCNVHERIYEDGSGYICRHCGTDMDDED